MKKFVSVLLTIALTAGLVPAVFAASDADLRFAAAADLHINLPREELAGEIDDEIYWYANRRAAMEDESSFILDAFLEQCAASDVDHVLIAGDLADNGRAFTDEHYLVRDKLLAFEQATGKDVFVIDGNHDLGAGDSATTVDSFREIYADLGYDKALTVDEKTCSYTADLGEKYRLIALDSCDPTVSTEDGMDASRVSWVLAQAKQARKDGRYPILMMHHNLLDHLPVQRVVSHDFIIKFHKTTAQLFADAGIKVVISGHEHCSDTAVFTSASGRRIYDFAITSLTMYPLQYKVFSFTDESISYETRTVDRIDTAALSGAVKGYSREQLDLMDAGLNEYSKGFMKKGVEYRLKLGMTEEKLGISPSSPFYSIIMSAVNALVDTADMPLYGENSASELASRFGVELPETDYVNGWDLATELVSMHYTGGEDLDLSSPEVVLLLRLVAVILRRAPLDVTDAVYYGAAGYIMALFGIADVEPLIETAFDGAGVGPAEYFAVALASPLIIAFTKDADGVDDNDGVIEPCGEKGDVIQTLRILFERVRYLIGVIIRVLSLALD